MTSFPYIAESYPHSPQKAFINCLFKITKFYYTFIFIFLQISIHHDKCISQHNGKFFPNSYQNHQKSRQISNFKVSYIYKCKGKNKMNWLEKILKNEQLCNNLSSFLDQYEAPDLAEALQLYRITHQTYICKTKQSIEYTINTGL